VVTVDPHYPDVVVTLRAEEDPAAPPPVRLRQALKVLLRRFGFRCVAMKWLDATPAAPQAGRSPTREGGGPA
jgi:hypothetical protein